jgi:hypothetical protein
VDVYPASDDKRVYAAVFGHNETTKRNESIVVVDVATGKVTGQYWDNINAFDTYSMFHLDGEWGYACTTGYVDHTVCDQFGCCDLKDDVPGMLSSLLQTWSLLSKGLCPDTGLCRGKSSTSSVRIWTHGACVVRGGIGAAKRMPCPMPKASSAHWRKSCE